MNTFISSLKDRMQTGGDVHQATVPLFLMFSNESSWWCAPSQCLVHKHRLRAPVRDGYGSQPPLFNMLHCQINWWSSACCWGCITPGSH